MHIDRARPSPAADEISNDAAMEIAHWLADHSGARRSTAEIIDEFANRLCAAGVPVMRMMCSLEALHPQIVARGARWRRGHGCEPISATLEMIYSDDYRQSPVRAIDEGAAAVRRRLECAPEDLDFPVLRDFAAEGATDYLALALVFSTGQRNFLSLSTDAAGGFRRSWLTLISNLSPLLALRLEIEASHFATHSLLEIYLGRGAARRVLSGQIAPGSGEVIRAAILFADLRGFTSFADNHNMDDVMSVLSAYYVIIDEAVNRHHGEVLKLIGDGVLAIFPIDKAEVAAHGGAGCCAAGAALEAVARLADLGPDALPEGVDALRAGFALHVGDVLYGNVGARERLDFTVIGAAVNETARLEALTREMEADIIASEDFARLNCFAELHPLGRHHLRGVRRAQTLYRVTAPANYPATAPEPARQSGA